MFAVNGTVSKLVLQAGLEPAQLTVLRATGAFAGLLVLGVALRLTPSAIPPKPATPAPPGRRLAVTRRELPLLAAYGVIGSFLVPMVYFVAISRIPVGIALLFEYTAPLLVALWARFGQRQSVRPRLWGGLALSLTGLACVADVWGDLRLNGVGMLAGFAAAVGWALYYLLGAHGVRQRDTVSLNTWAFGFAAAAGLLTQAISRTRGWSAIGETSHGVPVWLLSCYAVVLGSIAPYLLVAAALRHLPATSVGIVGMVNPVVAAAVAWLILGEVLNATQLVGGALILVGVGLAETARIATPTTTYVPRHRNTQSHGRHSTRYLSRPSATLRAPAYRHEWTHNGRALGRAAVPRTPHMVTSSEGWRRPAKSHLQHAAEVQRVSRVSWNFGDDPI
jgi:drug/metabolite transporter (DMT)-like permease